MTDEVGVGPLPAGCVDLPREVAAIDQSCRANSQPIYYRRWVWVELAVLVVLIPLVEGLSVRLLDLEWFDNRVGFRFGEIW